MSWLKSIFSSGPKADLGELVKNGAQIIDVRTKGEFQSGHIRGAVNIPLNDLPKYISRLSKEKPVITCCASGMRSATARDLLRSKGFTEVRNGGSWVSLQRSIA